MVLLPPNAKSSSVSLDMHDRRTPGGPPGAQLPPARMAKHAIRAVASPPPPPATAVVSPPTTL